MSCMVHAIHCLMWVGIVLCSSLSTERRLKEDDRNTIIPYDIPLALLKERESDTSNLKVSMILKVDPESLIWLIKGLSGSVRILQQSRSFNDIYNNCNEKAKNEIYKDFHSTDVWIPFLFRNQDTVKRLVNTGTQSYSVLFYYFETYPNLINLCAPGGWGAVSDNWKDVMKETIFTDAWKENNGLNFIMSASIPCAPVGNLWSFSNHDLSLFSRTTFLISDTSCTGRYAKDVISPVVVNPSGKIKPAKRANLLLCFANPWEKDYLDTCSGLIKSGTDIVQTMGSPPSNFNADHMEKSNYCLVRCENMHACSNLLFTISYLCIPVIMSEWLRLPFSRFINYSLFMVSVEESMVQLQPGKFIEYLRSIPQNRVEEMQAALLEARTVLMYDSSNIINPVSLSLAEAVLSRVDMCLQSSTATTTEGLNAFSSTMCSKILNRFKVGKPADFNLKSMAAMFLDKTITALL